TSRRRPNRTARRRKGWVAGSPGRRPDHGATLSRPPAADGALDGRRHGMSATGTAAPTLGASRSQPLTVPAVRARKGSAEPLVMITAYDAPGASIVDEAGVDIILVGDSLAMVVLGYDDTLQVTIDDMAHHVGAVARARPRALVVGDMPWLSYHVSIGDTVRNAARLVRAGAEAVKLEGGRKRVEVVEALVDAEMPELG